jgi:hypothetical protein
VKPGAWIDPSAYIKSIGDAGYQARKDDVRLTLTGKLSREGDAYLLTLDDVKPGPQVFVVQSATSKNEKEKADFASAFGRLGDMTGQTVELEAFWKPPAKKGEKAILLVRRVGPVSQAKTATGG